MKIVKAVKSIFKNHNESVQEVHITSDGTVFFQKNHADSHANGLEDKRVMTVTREQADAEPDVEESIEELDAAEKLAAAQADADAAAEALKEAEKAREAAEKKAAEEKEVAEKLAAEQEEIEASEKAAAAKKKK